jgi:hypothetical protein
MSVDELSAIEQREALAKAERKGRRAIEKTAAKLEQLVIVYVGVDEIRPNPWNPNRQTEFDFELLLRSMEDDGFTQPVLATHLDAEHLADPAFSGYSIGDIVIVDGEHRWRAARKLGFKEVPLVFNDEMGTAQMRVSTLRHNRAKGTEDIELSTEMLRDLEILGYKESSLEDLGMTQAEWDRLVEDVSAPESLADPEHSTAWVPDKAGSDIAPVEGRESAHDSGTWTNASTGEALEQSRRRETALKEAKTEEQREMITRDMSEGFHRVSLLLYGEDAEAAKVVLRGAPAEALAKLCRDALGKEMELADDTWVLLDDIIGRRTIPAESAQVLRKALDTAERRGDVTEKSRFQILEYWAASYLAEGPGANGA